MSELIASDQQRLDVGVVVSLFRIDVPGVGNIRFVPGTRDNDTVKFQQETYFPIPIAFGGLKYDSSGPAARPTMTISALDETTIEVLIGTDNLRGATVTRLRTLEKYLDDGTAPDPTRHWPREVFRIEGLRQRTRTEVSWSLASPLDYDKKKLPGRQVLRDICGWQYRHWTGQVWDYANVLCPYVGTDYYDRFDNPVATAAEDECSRRLSGCRRRFDGSNFGTLPFGGFVGVARVQQ